MKGEGIVKWNVLDEQGVIRPLELPALYVPTCKVRLLRPHSIIEKYNDENISDIAKQEVFRASLRLLLLLLFLPISTNFPSARMD